jgi:hypothetical protein
LDSNIAHSTSEFEFFSKLLELKPHQFGVREPAEFETAFAEMAAKSLRRD